MVRWSLFEIRFDLHKNCNSRNREVEYKFYGSRVFVSIPTCALTACQTHAHDLTEPSQQPHRVTSRKYSTFDILNPEFPVTFLLPSLPEMSLDLITTCMPLPVLTVLSLLHFTCLLNRHAKALNFYTHSLQQCQTLSAQILSLHLVLEKGQNLLPVEPIELPGALTIAPSPFYSSQFEYSPNSQKDLFQIFCHDLLSLEITLPPLPGFFPHL